MKVSILDTTLRDGEQTSGVSFSDSEKLTIAKLLLEDLKVDRIEVASARVSKGEFDGAQKILDWALKNQYEDRVEILGFVDGSASVDWIADAGGKILNLLCKGSLKHCESQLRKTPEEHLSDIEVVVGYALKKGLKVNAYLEDWSNGMVDSPDYVNNMVSALHRFGVNHIMLPDTLGVMNHEQTYDYCRQMRDSFPDVQFDFHAHNDYDLATANVFSAIKAGIHSIHTTLNGLGERAGNVPLSSVIGVIKDHFNYDMNIDEKKLYTVSKVIESFSGVRIPGNKPLIGEFVFTQTSGIHADGDNKNNLYHNDLKPERFGRKRSYALGKLSGKANIKKNLEDLGLELDADAMKKVTQKIIELGDRKQTVTKEDLPYIIADILKSEEIKQHIKIKNYSLSVAAGLKSVATLSIEIDERIYEETSAGEGQYDAFMQALSKIYKRLDKSYPALVDYAVSIPPGGKTNALVETIITWDNGSQFKTRGLDADQTIAAIKATIKMLNIIENKNRGDK